ncbi:MAG: sensor histidine kinase [Planctomycetota bacterium]|nr:MAG: sensor histidine kinase [Planctomycetota bacterium]
MAQRPVSAKRTYLYIVLTFVFLIVLPGLFLSYYSLTSLGQEQLVFEQRYREEYRRQLGLVMDSLEKHFGLMDYAITEEIIPRAVGGRLGKNFGGLVKDLVKEEPLIVEAFAFDTTGEVLYPPPSGSAAGRPDLLEFLVTSQPGAELKGKALRRLHLERGRLLDLYENALEMQNVQGDRTAARNQHIAITQLAKPSNGDLALLSRDMIANTYYREKNYEKALGLFREIAVSSDGAGGAVASLFAGEDIPLRLIAYFQWADCALKLGRTRNAANALSELYKGLLERRFSISAREKRAYLDIAGGRLDSLLKRNPVDDEIRRRYSLLRHERRRETWIKKLGGVISDSFAMDFKSKFSEMGEYLDKRLDYTVEREECDFRFIFRVGQRSDRKYIAAGFALDEVRLIRDVLPPLLSAERFPEEISVAAVGKNGKVLAGTKPLEAAKPHLEVAMPAPLSDMKLQVFFRDPRELSRIFARRRNLDIALISVLVVSLLLGVFLVLRFIRKELELTRLRASFVSNVSHELKTPLTSIRMFGEMLKLDRVPDENKRREYYDIISAESERLTKLIDNVLDFSRLEAGKKSYSFAPADPVEVVRRTLQVFSYYMQEQDFEVRTSFDEDVPVIQMDQDALSRSVLNLLSNAVKYSREEDRIIDVSVKLVEGHVRISVRDRGIGIREEDLERIFDKFYRAGSREIPEVSGTGLGLTLVQAVATAHGGQIDVQSSPGKGSIFTIALPLDESG